VRRAGERSGENPRYEEREARGSVRGDITSNPRYKEREARGSVRGDITPHPRYEE